MGGCAATHLGSSHCEWRTARRRGTRRDGSAPLPRPCTPRATNCHTKLIDRTMAAVALYSVAGQRLGACEWWSTRGSCRKNNRRAVRVLALAGWKRQANDVVHSFDPGTDASARATGHVVFFGGDAQNLRESMQRCVRLWLQRRRGGSVLCGCLPRGRVECTALRCLRL